MSNETSEIEALARLEATKKVLFESLNKLVVVVDQSINNSCISLQEALNEQQIENRKLKLKVEELEVISQKKGEAELPLLSVMSAGNNSQMEEEIGSLKEELVEFTDQNKQLEIINRALEKRLENEENKIKEFKNNSEILLEKFSNILEKINNIIEIEEEETLDTNEI